MQIKVNLQIFIFIAIFILTKQIAIYSWLMLFAFMHEMGHIFAGVLLGLKPKSLHIIPLGLTVVFETYIKKKNIEIKKIVIAAARTTCKFINCSCSYVFKHKGGD